jgi:F0F1-type ATP synthase assembly protein I
MDTSEQCQHDDDRSTSASAAADATALSVDIGLLLNGALISAYIGSFSDMFVRHLRCI